MTRLQNFFRKNARKLLLKRAHLVEQAEAFITREAISARQMLKPTERSRSNGNRLCPK